MFTKASARSAVRSNRAASIVAQFVALILIACLAAFSIHAQTTNGGAPVRPSGKIRGVVFDSLLMAPISGATVTLMSRMETVTSDDRGRFSFDDVSIGNQTIVFESAELDSLGLGSMGTTISMVDGETARVTLSTPSLRALWQRRCKTGTALSPDSGIVWGTIRDANNNTLLSDAVVGFSWYDMRAGAVPGIYVSDIRKEVLTDNTGLFFACGVPTNVVITTAAIDTSTARGKGASGFLEYAVGSRRLQRLDLIVSPDMIAPVNAPMRTREDSAAAARARGRATLKGVVLDDRKRPVADATITVASADTSVVTGANGNFVLGGLPAGTHAMQTKRIGLAPVSQMVSLRTDSVTDVTVIAAAVSVVGVYNVRAEATNGSDRTAFEKRRKLGFGYYAETKDLERRNDIASTLSTFPGLQVRHNGLDLQVTASSTFGRRCVPAVFLDGMFSSWQTVDMMRPADFRAIEAYPRASSTPPEYITFSQCGVVLFWSKTARW